MNDLTLEHQLDRWIDAATGEIVEPLSFDEATALTESIRGAVADLEEKVVRAFFGRVWVAMDYGSWDEYVQGEYKSAPLALPREDRRIQVASLRQQGLSLRAIGAVTGVSEATVHDDLATVQNLTVPERITGLDGKDRPATQPEREPASSPEINDTPLVAREACPCCGQSLPTGLQKEG